MAKKLIPRTENKAFVVEYPFSHITERMESRKDIYTLAYGPDTNPELAIYHDNVNNTTIIVQGMRDSKTKSAIGLIGKCGAPFNLSKANFELYLKK